jgi:hypothetical protein
MVDYVVRNENGDARRVFVAGRAQLRNTTCSSLREFGRATSVMKR